MKRPPIKDIIARAPVLGQTSIDFRALLDYIYYLENEAEIASTFIEELDQTVIRLRAELEKIKGICETADK